MLNITTQERARPSSPVGQQTSATKFKKSIDKEFLSSVLYVYNDNHRDAVVRPS